MRVLITGAAGQVGRALLASAPKGWQVEGVTRNDCDLADAAALHELVTARAPDWLINCAAYNAVDRAETEPDLAYAVNRDAVGAMADALREGGGRLLHISTDYVFDGRLSRPILPGDDPHPVNAYGRSKLAGEEMAGQEAIVCRTSWVHAPGHANFVTNMLDLMRQRDELRVVTDQIGAPTAASGLARVLWGLVQHGRPGLWHHRDAGVASRYDIAVAVAEEALALGLIARAPAIVPVASVDFPAAAARPGFTLLDDSATRALLGHPARHWREGVRETLLAEAARG